MMEIAPLARAKWQALGTTVELLLSDGASRAFGDSYALAQARTILERQLGEVDWACSRFREDSELTRVNAAAGRAVQVDLLLIEAVEVALRAAELTDGDVDPTVGAALILAGYDRDIGALQRTSLGSEDPYTEVCRSQALAPQLRATLLCGWKAIELDRERGTLRIPRGVKLDLGATAKAWTADRAVRAIYEAIGCGVLVSLGGDISTAGPIPPGQPFGQKARTGWRIYVTDDHRSPTNVPGQTVSIISGGLATSSTTARCWRHREQTMHHIIDPSSGVPAEVLWRTVSVAAGNCTDANVAATAAIVRGARAPEWLAELGLPARLVDLGGNVRTVGGWPCQRETLPSHTAERARA